MSRYRNGELQNFRKISKCTECVHYTGCSVWMAMLLMNEEMGLGHVGLDLIIRDINEPCPMHFSFLKGEAKRNGHQEKAHRSTRSASGDFGQDSSG